MTEFTDSVTIDGTSLTFTNTTSQTVIHPAAGEGEPTSSTRSVGTKHVLWPSVDSGSNVDYALGIAGGYLWSSVPNSTAAWQWYAGTTQVSKLDGAGNLTINGTLDATGIVSSGTISGSSTATGGSTSRGLSQHFSDLLSVLDFGAVGNGTSNDSSAFTTALNHSNNSVILAPAGYNFDIGTAMTTGASALLITGSNITNPVNLPGPPPDLATSVWNGSTPLILTQSFVNAGTTTDGSANQFLMSLQVANQVSHATNQYEKAILYIAGNNHDTGTIGDSGLVGIENQQTISNTKGRAWSYHGYGDIISGADGNYIGLEIESNNNGSNQTNILDASLTGKVGINLIAEGTVPSTSAINIISNPMSWNCGLNIFPGSISSSGNAIVIPNNAPISAYDEGGTVRSLIELNNSTVANLYIGPGLASGANTIIGSNTLPNGDNLYSLGNSGLHWTAVYAYSFVTPSDPSMKMDIAPLEMHESMLPVVMAIAPIRFKWKFGGYSEDKSSNSEKVRNPRPGRRQHWGFDATNVKAAFDAIGQDFGGHILTGEGMHALHADELVPVLWRAVQELTAKLEKLERRLS